MAATEISAVSADRGRVWAFDVLRVAAAVAVIVLHASAQHFVDRYPSDEWTARVCYNALVRWCVPVFLMISGALFLSAGRPLSLRHLYGKNVLRIVVAFFVWSYVYLFDKVNAGPAAQSIAWLLAGPSHFWYLKMLLGIYIAVPLLRAITAHRHIERYFIVLTLVVSFIIPFGLTLGKHYGHAALVGAFNRFYGSLMLGKAMGYMGYFVLGHYLHAYPPTQGQRRAFYALGIAATVMMACCTMLCSHLAGKAVTWFINYLTPTVLAQSVAVFVLATARPWRLAPWRRRLLSQASRLSFGIYLVHVLLIRTGVSHGIDSSWLPAVWFVPLYALGIFVVSYAVIWLLSKLPLAGRYLM